MIQIQKEEGLKRQGSQKMFGPSCFDKPSS